VYETSPGLVGARVVEIMEDGLQDLQHVRALQHVEEELLVMLAELPEEDEELLVEVYLQHAQDVHLLL
jgi:hypothetical protein